MKKKEIVSLKRYVSGLMMIFMLVACNSGKKAEASYFAVKKSYAQEVKEFVAIMKTASLEEQKAMMKDAPDRGAYRDTLLHFIEQYPKEDFVADAWVEIFKLEIASRNDSLFKVCLQELGTNHAKSPHLARIDPIFLSKSRASNIGDFMKQILGATESEEVKGIFTLGYSDWLTQNPAMPHYDLEKGLALLNEVIEKYSEVKVLEGPEQIPAPLGPKAESSKRRLTELAVGKMAPEIISQDLTGKKVRLSDHKGKVIMLDIWATWCGPCIKMIPDEIAMLKRLEDQPFELISISIDKKIETVEKFHKKHPMPWTHWFNGDKGGVLTQWNVHQYPTIILLDKEGVIRHRSNGIMEEEELNKAINHLLEI